MTESVERSETVLRSLDAFVDAFEDAWAEGSCPEVADFLPKEDHPEFELITTELLCIDLEYRQRTDDSSLVDEYCSRFPHLISRGNILNQLAFEDYRSQLQRGKSVLPQDYQERYGIETSDWPRPPATESETNALKRGSTVQAGEEVDRLANAVRMMPDVGAQVHQFDLVERLGEGQFGRVYLAKQRDLANRLVVVKLTTDLWEESDKLARLQHANIVPIYSVHQEEQTQTVCMPFLGRFTLKDWFRWLADSDTKLTTGVSFLKFLQTHVPNCAAETQSETQLQRQLSSFDHEKLCLWLASRLAAALGHAHERGILHRDMKPANVLLTDEGHPMVLDFNLSQEIVPGGRTSLLVGGTLPYMAPEHVRAVATGEATDVRSDVYSLGVMLFQLLSKGKLPFAIRSGEFEGSVAEMLADRLSVPSVEEPSVSAATKAIVRKCLAPKCEDRYQTALQLQEDLERQLSDRPLQYVHESYSQKCSKWIVRHPQVRSTAFLSLIAGVVILAITSLALVRGERLADMQSLETFHDFIELADESHASLATPTTNRELHDSARQTAAQALRLFDLQTADLVDNEAFVRLSPSRKLEVRQTLAELHFLFAFSAEARAATVDSDHRETELQEALLHNELAAKACGRQVWAIYEQRVSVLEKLGRTEEAQKLISVELAQSAEDSFDRYITSLRHSQKGDFKKSKQLLKTLVDDMPKDFFAWYLLGRSNEELGEFDRAEECFTACKTLSPESLVAYLNRGTARLKRDEFAKAKEDFDYVLEQAPDSVDARINRAYAWRGLRNYRLAIADLDAAEESGRYKTRIHLLRAKLWAAMGESEKSAADLQAGIALTPSDFEGWLARGLARLRDDVDGALADVRTALLLKPRSQIALHNLALILADHKKDNQQAIEVYDQLLFANASNLNALRGRAVVHARLGNAKKAIADIAGAFKLDRSAQTHFQAACVYSLISGDDTAKKLQATALLKKALQINGAMWRSYAKTDEDLATIRELSEYQELIKAVEAVHGS